MSEFKVKERRWTFQRIKQSALHCSVPLCTNSSKYNSTISFHSFPVDESVRAEWVMRIRRNSFTPSNSSRVCSRHFRKEDFVNNPGKLRRLKKGTVPVLFSWNNYEMPKASVRERTPNVETPPPPRHDPNSEKEMEVAALTPDHDYCVTPPAKMRADQLAKENATLRQKVKMLELQIQGLQRMRTTARGRIIRAPPILD